MGKSKVKSVKSDQPNKAVGETMPSSSAFMVKKLKPKTTPYK